MVAPDLLVSANPGCTLQIGMLIRERGVHIPAAHVVEVLDASIRGIERLYTTASANHGRLLSGKAP
jgi:glycolate oxidase iron-sulfur subunit